MNQTQKRLSIISLAISIGDTETIQLQILKLSPLKSDSRIQQIIQELQSENYAKAQALITEYINTPIEEIHQRSTLDETLSPEEEEAIIEEFDLFRIEEEQSAQEEITEIDDLGSEKQPATTEKTEDFDALLSLTSDDVLPNALELEQSRSPKDDFFDIPEEENLFEGTSEIVKDDFFDTPDTKTETEEDAISSSMESSAAPIFSKSKQDTDDTPAIYEPIPYIDQKLKNMQTQYPPITAPEGSYPSVDAWLIQISREGYSEEDVERMMEKIRQLKEDGAYAEAAQLLLVSAATQSKYAQFMLARSLFKGDLLEKNLPEAFTLINRLAMDDDYAEAICDLGQLYEYGIGIAKDKKRAEALYKEAVELGIKRAQPHYERLSKANKGLLGKLFWK